MKDKTKIVKELRDSGIDIIGDVQWGTHLCQFYQTKEDLIDILVPYFKAGLENNEFCMWVCWDPLQTKEAKKELNKALENLDDYIAKGQIEIVDYSRKQTERGDSGFAKMKQFWIDKERLALERGFAGLRLAGNTSWLEKGEWKDFKQYENEVDDIIRNHKMLAICPYSLDKCGPSEIIDVVGTHRFALIRRTGKWEPIENIELKKEEKKFLRSEIKYKALVEHIPNKIFVKDITSIYLSCNENYADDLNMKPEDVVGKTDYDFYPKELAEKYRTDDKRIIETGKTEDIEEKYIEGGKEKWVHTVKTPYKNGNGNIIGVLGIFRDVTERKKVEETLRVSEEKYKNLIENASDIIFMIDRNLKVMSINQSAAAIVGKQAGEMVGRSIFEIFPQAISNRYAKSLQEVFNSGVGGAYDSRLIVGEKDMQTDVRFNPIKDAAGKVVAVMGITRDITEQKKAEKVLKESEDKYRSLFSTTPSGVAYCKILVDEDNRPIDFVHLEVNNAWERSIGLKRENVVGRKITEVIPGIKESKTDLISIYGRVALTGEATNFELYFEPLEKWFAISVYCPCKGYFVAVFEDIAEQKKAEEAIKNLARFPEENASPVYRTSKEGVLLYANPASRRLILEDRTKIGDKIPEKWIGMIRNAYDSGKKQQKEIELSGRIFLFDLVPVIEGGYVNSYATDITEQKISELKVYESQKKFQSLVETTSDFIWEMDINGIYTYCSPQMERLWGFKPEQMIGKTPFDLLLPGGREQAMKAFSALSKSAVPFTNMEAPSFDSTGRVRFLEISGVPFFDIAGKLCGYRGITRDITERKKAEEKIKQQNIQLKKLDRIKTDFLNVTSHELRTPLAAMKGYLQMLSKQRLGDVTPEQKNVLEVVLRNTNRLDNLIQEILDISQLESGTMKLITEKTDISKMMEEVTETVQPNVNVKNIKINTELEEVPELVIDQQRIKQAIMNLVDNAIKFSPQGSTINLSVKMKKDNVLFEVQDFGRGIPKKEQKKIFESFYQVNSSIDRKFGGVGLGLAISRDIVLVHGGKIWVDSTVGKGSTFGFTLPIKSVINIQKKSKI